MLGGYSFIIAVFSDSMIASVTEPVLAQRTIQISTIFNFCG